MTVSINGIDQSVPSVEDYGRAVQDLTALKAIAPSERFDQQQTYVEDETRPYWFDVDSAAAESLPDIVEPNDAPASGRWIRLPPEGGGAPGAHGSTHTSIGADAIPAAVPAGASGLFTGADKTKLDGIGALANVTSVFGRTGVVVKAFGDYAHLDLSGIGTDDHHTEFHSMGAAAHVPASLAALNTKITDAVLVDGATKVSVDGSLPLTGPWNVGRFDVTLSFIAGADPVSNVTGLDSRKLGLEVRVWDGAAPQTRTGSVRFADRSGEDDQGQFTFSSNDNGGGAEVDFLTLRRDTAVFIGPPAGEGNFNLHSRNGVNVISINTGNECVITGPLRPSANNTYSLGSVTRVWSDLFVREIKPDAGERLILRRADGAAIFDLEVARTTLNGSFRWLDNASIKLGNDEDNELDYSTVQTNAGLVWGMQGAAGNYLLFTDKARVASDFAIAAQSTPTWAFHDGSVTLTNITTVAQVGTDLLFTPANAVIITQVAGTDPVDNSTGLDSRKLGFENRVWSGSAAVTRTIWVRNEGVPGVNDFSQLTISIDQAGAEADVFRLRFINSGAIQVMSPGRAMNFLGGSDALTAMTIALTGRTVDFAGPVDLQDDDPLRLGGGNEFQWVYETVNQTNSTLLFGTQGAEGNTVVFTDNARLAADHLVGTPGTPTWRYHDGSATVGNFGSITHDGTDFLLTSNAGFIKLNADVQVVGDIVPEGTSGQRDAGATDAAFNTVFTRKLRPDGSVTLQLFTGGGVLAFEIANSGIMTFNQNANSAFDVIMEGGADPVLFSTDAGLNRVGVGVVMEAHAGKLHVRQPVTDAAIPVVVMEQLDIDDTFINFIGTSAADGTRSISSDTTEDSAKVGAVRVEFNGALAWMRLFATES